jgi:hypothetical protein
MITHAILRRLFIAVAALAVVGAAAASHQAAAAVFPSHTLSDGGE